MRIRLDLAYDGSAFHGWAAQPGLRTVQGEVEAAIATVLRLDSPAPLTCAGRTDAGVHARGQVAHVDLDGVDPETLARRLQRFLPDDVTLVACSPAPPGFDARFSATERRYVYRLRDTPGGDPLTRGFVVAHRSSLDVAAMAAAAEHLVGEHDFASFCKQREGATTIRTLLELRPERLPDGLVATTVRADAFCHSMVRSLMGALVAVGEGRYEAAWAGQILAATERDPRVTVMPAHGLVLEEVVYPPDDQLAARAAEARNVRTAPE
ncbi:tRNA pseudouridine(38-40) synthase TruA [Aeromicrobium terrae]|uniref:tRNA pseudouridine(38-40) synthase TruA n=1 Tax=Aeromicrobium terrae TaxID=2498846 RepID=UPI001C9BCCD7|nr:tRNA pseudouridine(38-40) synthase TruA [Aeromicrobium terrae]